MNGDKYGKVTRVQVQAESNLPQHRSGHGELEGEHHKQKVDPMDPGTGYRPTASGRRE